MQIAAGGFCYYWGLLLLLGSLLGGNNMQGACGVHCHWEALLLGATVVGGTVVGGTAVSVFTAPVTDAVLSLWLSL